MEVCWSPHILVLHVPLYDPLTILVLDVHQALVCFYVLFCGPSHPLELVLGFVQGDPLGGAVGVGHAETR